MIQNYDDFCRALLQAGFSLGAGNPSGIYSVIPFDWSQQPPEGCAVRWHTGEPETDPWEWRMRVLDERDDIAYAKLFFKKSGYITREWYPKFLAVRRAGRSFQDAYGEGRMSHDAKRLYEALSEHSVLPLEEIKRHAGYCKDNASAFDRALVELQASLFVTMCGRRQRVSGKGELYGWHSTVFCTVDQFFGPGVMREAAKWSRDEAYEAIRERIMELNPAAEEKKIKKFIEG